MQAKRASRATEKKTGGRRGGTETSLTCGEGHRETVEHLIENAADVNMSSSSSSTSSELTSNRLNGDKESALHKAVSESTQNIVRVLCAAGASLMAKNRDGLTPVQLADEKGDTQIIDILSRHSGRARPTVSAEGSFGYEKWQTRPAAPAGLLAAGLEQERPLLPSRNTRRKRQRHPRSLQVGGACTEKVVGHKCATVKEVKNSDGEAAHELGEWGKAGGVGLSGKPREKVKKFNKRGGRAVGAGNGC
eukprot:749462-Hanusia_phi.AAC.2